MTDTYVSSGQATTGTLVAGGDTQTVYNGGIASASVISTGSYQYVSSGGLTVSTVLRRGNEIVYSGGSASATVVSSGGNLTLSGGSSTDVVLLSAGREVVSAGGFAYHTVVSAGSTNLTAVSGGIINSAVLYAGTATVSAGGLLSNTVFSAGTLNVNNGGVASNTTAVYTNVFVNAGGQLLGIHYSGATISAAGSGALVSGAVLNPNVNAVNGVFGNAVLLVYSSAVASDTIVNGTSGSPYSASVVVGNLGSANHTTVYSGGYEVVSGGGTATNTILSGGTLIVSSAATISGLEIHSGGTLDLRNVNYGAGESVDLLSGNLLTVTSGGNIVYQIQLTGDYTGDYFHVSYDNTVSFDGTNNVSGTLITEDTTPCYCPGTLIATDKGEVLVEDLVIGDRVLNHKGEARAIKWIGHRAYGGRFAAMNREILPICFKAGSIAENTPRRDLWVSPHHAFYLNGVLIEAKDLVNGVSVYQANSVKSVKYFHVELDSHDVIIAEGALAESFVDDNGRGIFHNAHEYAALYADAEEAAALRYYAPRVDCGEEVEAARAALDARAETHFSAALKSVA